MLAPQTDRIADLALRAVARGRHAVISGPVGSGRQSLVEALAARESAAVLSAPDLSASDTAGALLAAAARAVGFGDDHAWTRPDGTLPESLSDAIAAHPGLLVVRLAGPVPGAHAVESSGRLTALTLEILRVVARARRVIWVVDRDGAWERFDVLADPFELPRFTAPLSDEVAPELSAALAELHVHVPRGVERAPSIWRAAAGCVALGASPESAAAAALQNPVAAPTQLAELAVEVAGAGEAARHAMLRLAVTRAPVPRAALRATAVADEYWDAVTSGLGYGDPVSVHPTIRKVLHACLEPIASAREFQAAHADLAHAWRLCDGATSPAMLSVDATRAWSEKVHHLARGGDCTMAEWDRQTKPSPAFFWDAAQALSHASRYAESAELYRRCVAAFPDDPYAHHYLAFNLDRAKLGPPAEVRAHFARACELDPSNPWWNARYVTHLIERNRFIDAQRAWRLALERIDPDGTRSSSDAWLVAHLHHHVAEAWCQKRAWVEAEAVLRDVPTSLRREAARERPAFGRLGKRIEAARDAERRAFEAYLAGLSSEPLVDRLRDVWAAVLAVVPDMPAPAVGLDAEEVRLMWSRAGIALEVALELPSGSSWGGHDHMTDDGAHGDSDSDAIGAVLVRWLQRVRRGG